MPRIEHVGLYSEFVYNYDQPNEVALVQSTRHRLIAKANNFQFDFRASRQ
jgi:hypothetical protein